MILEEVDLDVPNEDKDSRFNFRNEVRCIASHYYSFLPKKFSAEGFWKILVECVEEDSDPIIYLKVNVVKVRFQYEKYLTLNNFEKKVMILDALHRGVMRVCAEQSWEPAIFENCRDKVVEFDYNYFWTFKKPKISKNKKYSAAVYCHHDIDLFSAEMVVSNVSGDTLFKKLIFEDVPNEFSFSYKLGDFSWVSNDEVKFYDKSKNCIGSINLSKL